MSEAVIYLVLGIMVLTVLSALLQTGGGSTCNCCAPSCRCNHCSGDSGSYF